MSECKAYSNPCETTTLQVGGQVAGEDFTACLFFGSKLVSKNGIISYTAGTIPADGTYSTITIKNGCITGVGTIEGLTYTSNPCASIPSSCTTVTTATEAVSVSSSATNLSTLDSTGAILTTLSATAGNGISLRGTGTTQDPLVISVASSSNTNKTYINTGNAWVTLSGSGTQTAPYVVSHKTVLDNQQTINGMTFDKAGHLVSYSAPTGSATIKGVIEGDGISTTMNASTGIATISLAEMSHPINKTVTIAGYKLTFDKYNRITKLVEPSGSTSAASVCGTSHVMAALSSSSESFQIELGEPAYIKVDMIGDGFNNIVISIDGQALVTKYNNTVAAAVSSAIYAAGTHTVKIAGSCVVNTIVTAAAVAVA